MNLNTFSQSQILQPKTKVDGQLGILQNHVLPFCLEQELCSMATCKVELSGCSIHLQVKGLPGSGVKLVRKEDRGFTTICL